MLKQIGRALEVFISGAELFDKAYPYMGLRPQLSCEGHGEVRWDHGELFYRSVTVATAAGFNDNSRTDTHSSIVSGPFLRVGPVLLHLRSNATAE